MTGLFFFPQLTERRGATADLLESTRREGDPVSKRNIIEKLDGNAACATVVEVTFGPGQKDSPHCHTGPVFGYVMGGEYEHDPLRRAGQEIQGRGYVLRSVRICTPGGPDPSGKTRTRLLAVVLHSRETT